MSEIEIIDIGLKRLETKARNATKDLEDQMKASLDAMLKKIVEKTYRETVKAILRDLDELLSTNYKGHGTQIYILTDKDYSNYHIWRRIHTGRNPVQDKRKNNSKIRR